MVAKRAINTGDWRVLPLKSSHVTLIMLMGFIPLGGNTLRPVHAGWIDPDTPKEAYRTKQLSARNPKSITKSNSKKIAKHSGENSTAATTSTKATTNETETINATDTEDITETVAPTQSPSAMPTYSPTKQLKEFVLVMSDEFNIPNRTFEDGADPKWTALNKNDYTNDALHCYSPQNAQTNENGEFIITTEATDTEIIGFDEVKRKKTHVTKHFRSAMVQSWNKFCFTGGIIEAEAIMPGDPHVGGLRPAFWLLGNLARHTYVGSSKHIWPWSSTDCTQQGMDAQLINGCQRAPHYGLKAGVGRGAPEIDIFEVQPGNIRANTGPFLRTWVGQPFMSASFQVAPGRPTNRPTPTCWPAPGQWYDGLTGGNMSALNIVFYGSYNHFQGGVNPELSDYWSDAISFNRQLGPEHFTGLHKYRLEWDVPDNETEGYLHWFLDDKLVLAINGTAMKNSGCGAEISSEPSYIILNTAVSKQWGFPIDCPPNCQDLCGFVDGFCDMLKNKPQMKFNYIRVYQDPDNEKHKVGCSTPERPTRKFIQVHSESYKSESDDQPLKSIQRGHGPCDPDAINQTRGSCGGSERGMCTPGKFCECKKGWTGPHCLAPDGFDDILWDAPDKITDLGFVAPTWGITFLYCLYVFFLFMVVSLACRERMNGWTPIPT